MSLRKQLPLVLLCLLGALGGAILLAGGLFGFDIFRNPQLDIQMHNTYFVTSRLFLVGILLIPMLLLGGLTAALSGRRSVRTYLLIAVLSALTIGLTTYLIAQLTMSGMSGWTIYPPLNAKEDTLAPPANPYEPLLNGAYILQFLAVATLSYSSYRAGKAAAARTR